MTQTFKVAIPMAGLGTRLRPHTWNKPKPLLRVAGRAILDYVLDQMKTLPDPENVEYIFIVGPQGDQLKVFMEQNHPEKKVHYVPQVEMRGQSDALYQARQHLSGPMLMVFSDTLIETHLGFLKTESSDGVAWVKPVDDPRRFGVAQVDAQGWVSRLIEKPQDIKNNLAVVGFYYFRSGEELITAIEEQMRRDLTLKGEYFLADAVNILLEKGAKIHTHQVETWLDAGTPDSLLETNRYLLEHGHGNHYSPDPRPGVSILPPVFIHETARIESSVIGPYVSLGAECHLKDVVIRNSIIEEGTEVCQMVLENTLLGRHVHVEGQMVRLNLGDESWGKQ